MPFFFVSLNSTATGAARTSELRRAFAGASTHLELVPAVDGNASARSYTHAEAQYNHLLKRNTMSEIGCSMSHVQAIRRAEAHCQQSGESMAVIMEDDVTAGLLPYWRVSLPQLAASLPDNWAVVQLQLIAQESVWDDLMSDWRAQPTSLFTVHDKRRHFGTGAYMIHLRGMRQVLDAFTQPNDPPGAASLARTIGGKLPFKPGFDLTPGQLVIPLELDEVQADVHLVYSLAQPVLLATPPLLACDNSATTIEHHSATRLVAQNAAQENDAAHEVSERLALAWAREALNASLTHAAVHSAISPAASSSSEALTSLTSYPYTAPARVGTAELTWSHYFCSHLHVRMGQSRERGEPPRPDLASSTLEVARTATMQLSTLVGWLDGHDFAITLYLGGTAHFRLSVHSDASSSVQYPMYKLFNRSALAEYDGAGEGTSGGSGGSKGGGGGGGSSGARAAGGVSRRAAYGIGGRATAAGASRSGVGGVGRRLLEEDKEETMEAVAAVGAADGVRLNASATAEVRQLSATHQRERRTRRILKEKRVRGGKGGGKGGGKSGGKSDESDGGDEGEDGGGGEGKRGADWFHPPKINLEKLGWRRVQLVRGGLSVLTFRITPSALEVYCEGVLLEAHQWSDRGIESKELSAALQTTSKSPLAPKAGATRGLPPKPTKVFIAWTTCSEDESADDRGNGRARSALGARVHMCAPTDNSRAAKAAAQQQQRRHACTAIIAPLARRGRRRRKRVAPQPLLSDRTLEWRSALRLPVPSYPLLLPRKDDALEQTRFIRYRRSRCVNEVKLDSRAAGVAAAIGELHGRSGRYAVVAARAPPPPPPRGGFADQGAAHASPDLQNATAACTAHCAQRDQCIGFRVNRVSVLPLLANCVFVKALRSSRTEDCDLIKLRPRLAAGQVLALPEKARHFRKPYREATGFLEGDVMTLVGTRTQLSNVPTKVLFSHVASPEEGKKAKALKPKSAAKAAAANEAHLGLFIDWKKRRTWINMYSDGAWGSEQPLQDASTFHYRIGETYALNITRTRTGLRIHTGSVFAGEVRIAPRSTRFLVGGRAAVDGEPPFWGVHHAAANRAVNQISVLGSAVEKANVYFATPQWRTMKGVTCANEIEPPTRAAAASAPRRTYDECRAACAAVPRAGPSEGCTGFEYKYVDGDDHGMCRLLGALKTKTISSCQVRESRNWDLYLRLQKAPARWYNVAMAPPRPKPGSGGTLTAASVEGRRLDVPPVSTAAKDDALLGWIDGSVLTTASTITHTSTPRFTSAVSAPVTAVTDVRAPILSVVPTGSVGSKVVSMSPPPSTSPPPPVHAAATAITTTAPPLDAHGPSKSWTTPCVLRESSYNYCGNPAVLTKEANEQLMENLYGAWWAGQCTHEEAPADATSPTPLRVHSLQRLQVDRPLHALGLVPELATEDLVLVRHGGRILALASLIEIKSWEASARRSNQRRRPFIFDIAQPQNGTSLRCQNCDFNPWEKNWMPFVHDDGRLLAVRWFAPHTVVQIHPDNGTTVQLYETAHGFATGAEIHGGTPPLRYDAEHYLTVVRLRTGSWRNNRETRNYVHVLYLFEARPPFAVSRVSVPFTLPSCVHGRLHMLIQVAKSLVEVEGGFTLCWGELDCYSCCATLPRSLVDSLLHLSR